MNATQLHLNVPPTRTTAEENATMPCFGEYAPGHSDCEGGVGAGGVKRSPCACLIPCRNVLATTNATKLITPRSLYVGNRPIQPAPQAAQMLPTYNRGPGLPAAPAQPAPLAPQPWQAPETPARRAAPQAVPDAVPGQMVGPVHYQAVAPAVASRLPVSEPTHLSKPRRFAAEVARAGLSGALLQAGSFIANVPFFNGSDELYLPPRAL